MKGRSDDLFSVFILVASFPILMWALSGGFNNFTMSLGNSSSSGSQANSTNCQSYIDQIDSLNGQISQLNTDVSNAKNSDSSGFSMTELLIGFIIGAGIVIAYFYYHEKAEKEREEFNLKSKESLSAR
jgi:hypothetical protein